MFDRHFNTFLNEGTKLDMNRNAVQVIVIVTMIIVLVTAKTNWRKETAQYKLNVFIATSLFH